MAPRITAQQRLQDDAHTLLGGLFVTPVLYGIAVWAWPDTSYDDYGDVHHPGIGAYAWGVIVASLCVLFFVSIFVAVWQRWRPGGPRGRDKRQAAHGEFIDQVLSGMRFQQAEGRSSTEGPLSAGFTTYGAASTAASLPGGIGAAAVGPILALGLVAVAGSAISGAFKLRAQHEAEKAATERARAAARTQLKQLHKQATGQLRSPRGRREENRLRKEIAWLEDALNRLARLRDR